MKKFNLELVLEIVFVELFILLACQLFVLDVVHDIRTSEAQLVQNAPLGTFCTGHKTFKGYVVIRHNDDGSQTFWVAQLGTSNIWFPNQLTYDYK